MAEKKPSESEIQMREMVMPGDTNEHGTIFGGKIMSWIDIACAMVATKHSGHPVVTVHIDDIDFISPIKVGHHVIIKASMNYTGRTSMVIGVKVESENPYNGQIRKTTKAYMTFVALDDFGKPIEVAKLVPQTDQEKRRYNNAEKRKEAKVRLNSSLEST